MASLTNVLPGGFDATAVEPQSSRVAIPAGVYDVEITSADLKDTKSREGTGLNIEFTVIDGEYAKRKIFQFINIRHTNDEAERIGQSQLSGLCRAVNMPVLTDSDQLFSKTLRIRVRVKPADGKFDERNEVTGYEPLGDSAPPQKAAAKAAVNPWLR